MCYRVADTAHRYPHTEDRSDSIAITAGPNRLSKETVRELLNLTTPDYENRPELMALLHAHWIGQEVTYKPNNDGTVKVTVTANVYPPDLPRTTEAETVPNEHPQLPQDLNG